MTMEGKKTKEQMMMTTMMRKMMKKTTMKRMTMKKTTRKMMKRTTKTMETTKNLLKRRKLNLTLRMTKINPNRRLHLLEIRKRQRVLLKKMTMIRKRNQLQRGVIRS